MSLYTLLKLSMFFETGMNKDHRKIKQIDETNARHLL